MSIDNPIRDALKRAPQLHSSSVTLLLREAYETTYGIYNHDRTDPNRPLAILAAHPAENASLGSTLYERIEQFAELNVHKFFGLSFAELLELPNDVVLKILEVSGKRQKFELEVAQSLQNRLENKT